MNHRMLVLVRKEFIQFFRDWALVFLVLYTFVEIALCGWALTLDVRHMPTAIFDGDHSPQSQAVIEQFAALSSFKLVDRVNNPQAINHLMDQGSVKFGLIIPAGFGQALAADSPAQLQLVFDGQHGASHLSI